MCANFSTGNDKEKKESKSCAWLRKAGLVGSFSVEIKKREREYWLVLWTDLILLVKNEKKVET